MVQLSMRKAKYIFAFLLLLYFSSTYALSRDIPIPGNIYKLSSYVDFHTMGSEKDFLYHFNEMLLNAESPNGNLVRNGIRKRLYNMFDSHERMKSAITGINGNEDFLSVKIKVAAPKGFKSIKKLLNIAGLDIVKHKKNKYTVMPLPEADSSDYYKFLGLTCESIQKQLEITGYFYLMIKESMISVDDELYEALEGIGRGSNFFDKLIGDEKFSLIYGACLNFSNRELRYLLDVCGKDFFKKVYRSPELAMGLYVLSPVLRVVNGELLLPGGLDARQFWVTLVGSPVKTERFIRAIAYGDEGRLNFLYRTSFYMSDSKFKAVFLPFTGIRFREILEEINLRRSTKIAADRYPVFRDFNFFSMLNTLTVKGDKVFFPVNVRTWYDNVAGSERVGGSHHDYYYLLLKTLAGQNGKGRFENDVIKSFVTIYSKFINRPEIFTSKVSRLMFTHFKSSSILIDYIEKLNIRKSETVLKLFEWYAGLLKSGSRKKELFTSLFQSVFEVIVFRSMNSKNNMDNDEVLNRLLSIPLNDVEFTDQFLTFINQVFIDLSKGNPNISFLNMVCADIPSRILTIEEQKFLFDQRGALIKDISRIIESQELLSLSQIMELSSLLKKYSVAENSDMAQKICSEINELAESFPDPGIAASAPSGIRRRVEQCSRSVIKGFVKDLRENSEKHDFRKKASDILNRVRKDYLVLQLRDYLLGVVYALNAKDSRLKPFINPNLVRLHDFEFAKTGNPWNRSEISWEKGELSCFYIAGGLSRLNLLFAECLKDKLFSLRFVYDSAQITSVLNNILWYYRSWNIPGKSRETVKNIESGLALIERGRQNISEQEHIMEKLAYITTGNHYRRVHDYFSLKSDDSALNFSELYALGGGRGNGRSFRAIGLNSFGTLLPLNKRYMPLELTRFRKAGWTMGEFIDELQLKIMYSFGSEGVSDLLAGEVAYRYLSGYCRRYFCQNYKGDFFNTYAVFDIFNKAILRNIVQLMKRDGGLKLL